jgi:thiamine-monophosphate kinase
MSDLAAMGALSQFAFLGLSLPTSLPDKWVDEFLNHFVKSCHSHNILLLGGDTTASQHGVFVSVTLVAQIPTIYLKRRTGAQWGNIIAIVGTLGDAYAGLMLLEENKPGFSELKNKVLRPQAKSLEGAWLGQQKAVTTMMDISDGLYVDLTRLCKASTVGAEIDLLALPASPQLTQVCHDFQWDIFKYMLTGGEDYGLLITIDETLYPQVAKDFYRNFDYHIQPIGTIIPEQKVKLMKNGVSEPLSYVPFSHFGEKIDYE